jgi:hypothetical protein
MMGLFPTCCHASCEILMGTSRAVVAWPPDYNGNTVVCVGTECHQIGAKRGISFFDFAGPPGTPVSASAPPAGKGDLGQNCIALVPSETKGGYGSVAPSAFSGIFALLGGIITAMFIAGTGRDQRTSSWIELYRANLRRYSRDSSVDIHPPQAPDMDGRGLRRISSLRRKLSDQLIPSDSEQLSTAARRAIIREVERELDRAIVRWFGTPAQRVSIWWTTRGSRN